MMEVVEQKRGRGRPRKAVDETLVLKLARIGCTVAEISAITDVSPDTLQRNYAATLEKGRERGKSSLRRMQWKAARSGNVAMMIWLGKQMLGQRDRHDFEHTGKDGEPLVNLEGIQRLVAHVTQNGSAATVH